MKTVFNSPLLSEDADIIFGANGDATTSQNQILIPALNGVPSETGISDVDWQAGFMLGNEGDEIVENVVSEVGESIADVRSAHVVDVEEAELLYVEDDANFAHSLAIERSANNDYFDVDAFVPSSNLTESLPLFVTELESFLESPIENSVNIDTIFDVMGLSGNRTTDEKLYFNDPAFSKISTQENTNSFGDEIAITADVSFSDLELGKLIDQMADQMFILNES
jgi:hypothetical protein